MEEVAEEGRYPYRHAEILLEEMPEDLQQKFLSVTPGDVLEPIARGDGFHLCRIIAKAEPDVGRSDREEPGRGPDSRTAFRGALRPRTCIGEILLA